MRYTKEGIDLTIDASGGYRALEALGYVSEFEARVVEKKAENKSRIEAWVAENCCTVCKKTEAFCTCETEGEMGKKKAVKSTTNVKDKTVEKQAVKTEASSSTKKAAVPAQAAGPTRNELMLEVKAKGIKNFRVMNKEELAMIVGGATPQQIEAIQLAAVSRWKSGFGKRK